MQTLLALSLLLRYPEEEVLSDLDLLERVFEQEAEFNKNAAATLAPLFSHLRTHSILDLEKYYTSTFDHSRTCDLHLYEHLYGESALRGIALADLRAKYATIGYMPDRGELPDYAPHVLEYLSLIPREEARGKMGKIVSLAILEKNLLEIKSPYACIFTVLAKMSPSVPPPIPVAPVRDMEEAMQKWGIDQYGSEPLLGVQVGCKEAVTRANNGGQT